MDAPKDRSELETILGTVTYLTRFAPTLATLTAPLRNLLKKDVEFVWNESHDEALQKIKDVQTDSPVLAYFNPKLDVTRCRLTRPNMDLARRYYKKVDQSHTHPKL